MQSTNMRKLIHEAILETIKKGDFNSVHEYLVHYSLCHISERIAACRSLEAKVIKADENLDNVEVRILIEILTGVEPYLYRERRAALNDEIPDLAKVVIREHVDRSLDLSMQMDIYKKESMFAVHHLIVDEMKKEHPKFNKLTQMIEIIDSMGRATVTHCPLIKAKAAQIYKATSEKPIDSSTDDERKLLAKEIVQEQNRVREGLSENKL